MKTIKLNDDLPNVEVELTTQGSMQLNSLKGQNVVLYFYPKDSTPGCTTEGQNFRDNHSKFKKLNTVILGISRENIKSHDRFREKQSFPFELIADTNETLCQLFDVLKQKSMFGKKYIGIERSTFLFNSDGKLMQEWRKLKVTGHVAEVLEAVKTL